MIEPDKWRCEGCGEWTGREKDMDRVKDPRGPDIWVVCPDCRTPEHMVKICDESACGKDGSCGWPTPEGGYRHTCFDHSYWNQANIKRAI